MIISSHFLGSLTKPVALHSYLWRWAINKSFTCLPVSLCVLTLPFWQAWEMAPPCSIIWKSEHIFYYFFKNIKNIAIWDKNGLICIQQCSPNFEIRTRMGHLFIPAFTFMPLLVRTIIFQTRSNHNSLRINKTFHSHESWNPVAEQVYAVEICQI